MPQLTRDEIERQIAELRAQEVVLPPEPVPLAQQIYNVIKGYEQAGHRLTLDNDVVIIQLIADLLDVLTKPQGGQ